MNIAGSAEKLQQDTNELGITTESKAQAARGDAGYCSDRTSAARTTTLGVRSHATGLFSSITGRGDWISLNLSGGLASVQRQSARIGVPSSNVALSAHQTATYFGSVTTALVNSGRRNYNVSQQDNPHTVRLGEEIGEHVRPRNGKYTLPHPPLK